MGCGCQKKAAAVGGNAGRGTIYQVLDTTQSVVAEFQSLQEARQKAVEVSGRVRVTTKPQG